jgi:hypothetical protein
MISFQEVMDFLKNQSLSIVGLVGMVIIYKKQTKKKSPCYGIKSTNIIKNLDSHFENIAMYHLKNGTPTKEIKDLTVTKIIFWNDGKETIYQNDITTAKPLRIRAKQNYKILDAKIIYTKTGENLFTVKISENESYLDIDFEYIDKGEGIVIQVLHNGKSNNDITFEGTLKGCRLRRRYLEKRKKMSIRPSSRFNSLFIKKEITFDFKLTILCLMTIFYIIAILNDYITNETQLSLLYLKILLVLGLVLITYFELNTSIPSGFDIFGEDI